MISIHDYNRMCILRRERLLKDQTDLLGKKSNQNSSTTPVIPTSTVPKQSAIVPPLTTASSIVNNVNAKTTAAMDADKVVTKQHTNASSSNNGQMTNKVQVPHKILEQNSLIPINHSSSTSSTSSTNSSSSSGSSKPNENSSDSLLRFRFSKSNKSSLLKSNASHHAKPASIPPQLIPSSVAAVATAIASNPLAKLPIPLSNVLTQSNVVSITSTPSISAMLGMTQAATPPPPIQMIPNPTPPITITNVSSGSAVNQSNVSSLEALFRTTNQVTTTPTTMWQWAEQLNKSNSITPIDNSATSILSKIPKSLTVIPQQKSKGIDE